MTTQATHPACVSMIVVAAVALNLAVHIDHASVGPNAMLALTAALVALLTAVAMNKWKLQASSDVLRLVIAVGLGLQVCLMAATNFAFETRRFELVSYFAGALGVTGMLLGLLIFAPPAQQRVIFVALLAIFAGMAVYILWLGPTPRIDLIVYHKVGINALWHGVSPYRNIYPNIYTPAESLVYYGAPMNRSGMLQVGYPYFPLSLILALPAELLGGDFRLAELAALLVAAALIAGTRPTAWSMPIAAILLFAPRSFFFLRHGWMEPFVLMLLCFCAFSYYRAPRLLPFALGLFFASKQYLVIAFPLVVILLPRPIISRGSAVFLLKLMLTGAAVSLPVILLDPAAFFHSAIWMFLRAPYRADSLSYLTWFEIGRQQGFPILGFLAPLITLSYCLLRARPTFTYFLGSFLAVMLPFFAFNKQAFANYYHFMIGATCLLAALMTARREKELPLVTATRSAEPAWVPQAAGELVLGATLLPNPFR